MTWDDLQRIGDDAHVGMAALGRNALTGGPVDRLPPRLWDALRIELQRRYRNATGEEFAVLIVETLPAPSTNKRPVASMTCDGTISDDHAQDSIPLPDPVGIQAHTRDQRSDNGSVSDADQGDGNRREAVAGIFKAPTQTQKPVVYRPVSFYREDQP